MFWSTFTQTYLFVLLGGYIYSCGKAGASLMAPITNALQRATEAIAARRKKEEDRSITPDIRS